MLCLSDFVKNTKTRTKRSSHDLMFSWNPVAPGHRNNFIVYKSLLKAQETILLKLVLVRMVSNAIHPRETSVPVEHPTPRVTASSGSPVSCALLQIGQWSMMAGMKIDDITWPGDDPTPPKGRPDKYHIKVVTIQEKPYVVHSDPDKTGQCPAQAALCRIAPENVTNG